MVCFLHTAQVEQLLSKFKSLSPSLFLTLFLIVWLSLLQFLLYLYWLCDRLIHSFVHHVFVFVHSAFIIRFCLHIIIYYMV